MSSTTVALTVLLSLLCVVQPIGGSKPWHDQERHKRTLVYTKDGATGILIALSVPLLIPDRNIFMAYNFEANYGMPSEASDFTQGILKKGDNDQITEVEESRSARPVRSSSRFTRKKLYRTIELNLTRHWFDGKKCILRMICELARLPANETNGLLGDLLQLVFTPSSSPNEKLPREFYLAEEMGRQHSCKKYEKYCPKDPLEAVSLLV